MVVQRSDNNPDDSEDDSVDDDSNNDRNRAEAMAATMNMGQQAQQPQTSTQRRTNTTAADRAILGTMDAEDNAAEFVFQDENGLLVQSRFVQFLNT
jgi:hypothetical protein